MGEIFCFSGNFCTKTKLIFINRPSKRLITLKPDLIHKSWERTLATPGRKLYNWFIYVSLCHGFQTKVCSENTWWASGFHDRFTKNKKSRRILRSLYLKVPSGFWMMLVLKYFFGNHFIQHKFTVLCLEHILLKSCKHHAAAWQRPIHAIPHSPLISTLVLSYSLFCVSVWLNSSWHCLFNCLRQKIGIVYDTSLTLHIESTTKSYPFMSLTCT